MLFGILAAALGLILYFSIVRQSFQVSFVLVIVWLICGSLAMHAWWVSPQGLLQWDGEQWHWMVNSEGQACQMCRVWDFQQFVWVRMAVADAPTQWLWLESRGNALEWDALRRAVVHATAGFTESSPAHGLEGQQ